MDCAKCSKPRRLRTYLSKVAGFSVEHSPLVVHGELETERMQMAHPLHSESWSDQEMVVLLGCKRSFLHDPTFESSNDHSYFDDVNLSGIGIPNGQQLLMEQVNGSEAYYWKFFKINNKSLWADEADLPTTVRRAERSITIYVAPKERRCSSKPVVLSG